MMQMGYKIHYTDVDRQKKQKHRSSHFCLTTLLFALYLLLVSLFWPEGSRFLKNMLISGTSDTAMDAIAVFAQELNCGIPLPDAAGDFCRRIICHD